MASPLIRIVRALRTPRPGDPEGRMTLGEHLRELRNRLVIAVLVILVLTIIAWFFYDPILKFLTHPFCELQKLNPTPPPGTTNTDTGGGSGGSGGGGPETAAGCNLYFTTIFQGFLLQLKVSAIVAVIASSPVWFYQIWAFITPGLRHGERKWTAAFLCTAVPLFLGGAALAYLVLSKGLQVLLSFVPEDFRTLITIDHYFGYAAAMLAIFGVAFELPLLILLLNLAGILTFQRLKTWQRRAVLLIFVFAAVATPSQDPFSMLVLALSMTALFEASVLLAYINDRRRGRLHGDTDTYADLDDDETSPLEMDSADDR